MSPLRTFTICAAILTIKWYITIAIQGGKRFRGGSRPAEDSKLGLSKTLGKGVKQTFGQSTEGIAAKAIEEDIRWQRIVLNDIENIPIGLIVGLSCILAGSNQTVNRILDLTVDVALISFTIARVAHTICYAKAIQPWRGIFWLVGIFSVITMALTGAIHTI
jgi:glutathione S-transferase